MFSRKHKKTSSSDTSMPPPIPSPPPPQDPLQTTMFQQYSPNTSYNSPQAAPHPTQPKITSHIQNGNGIEAILAYSNTPSPSPTSPQQQAISRQQQQQFLVGDEEYNRLLKNYRLAHERIEDQRQQLLMQERLNASLRKHVSLLEGGDATGAASVVKGSTVDDFTIKNSSSGLERRINRFASDTLSSFRTGEQRAELAKAIYRDVPSIDQSPFLFSLSDFSDPGSGIVLQSLLRHALSNLLADAIVNSLLVTDSDEANRELTKLHAILFNREPLVASVWRRQTFSASITSLSPSASLSLLHHHIPNLLSLLNPSITTLTPSLSSLLEGFHTYARTLHSSATAMGGGGGIEGSGFYQAYVPQVGTGLDPGQLELIKRCYRTERGEPERVGACLFPGLVKESAIDTSVASPSASTTSTGAGGFRKRETRVVVVRRAQVICECALAAAHTTAFNYNGVSAATMSHGPA